MTVVVCCCIGLPSTRQLRSDITLCTSPCLICSEKIVHIHGTPRSDPATATPGGASPASETAAAPGAATAQVTALADRRQGNRTVVSPCSTCNGMRCRAAEQLG